MKEIWKNINKIYSVSNLGRIKMLEHKVKNVSVSWGKKFVSKRTIKERISYGSKIYDGYYRVTISGKGYPVHRLVAIHFIPNPKNKPFVNHKNSDRSDNCVSNLEWVTASENVKHYIRNNRGRWSKKT
jgi:hypothetical protein